MSSFFFALFFRSVFSHLLILLHQQKVETGTKTRGRGRKIIFFFLQQILVMPEICFPPPARPDMDALLARPDAGEAPEAAPDDDAGRHRRRPDQRRVSRQRCQN